MKFQGNVLRGIGIIIFFAFGLIILIGVTGYVAIEVFEIYGGQASIFSVVMPILVFLGYVRWSNIYSRKGKYKRFAKAGERLLGPGHFSLEELPRQKILGIRQWQYLLRAEIYSQEFKLFDSLEPPASRYRSWYTFIACSAGVACRFTITRNSLLSKLDKLLGNIKNIQTGVTELDDAFLFTMSNETWGRPLILDPKFRDALEIVKTIKGFQALIGRNDCGMISSFGLSSAVYVQLQGSLEKLTKERLEMTTRALRLVVQALDAHS